MARIFKNESEAADVVVGYLRDLKHEVYCEVETGIGRIDIIAVFGKIVTSIEVKNRCSLNVLGQAIHRRPFVHKSIAAFPFPDKAELAVLESVCKQTGIGIWNIGFGVQEFYAPKVNRRSVSKYVINSLCDEQKNQKAGLNKGYWSPFQDTKKRLIKHVQKNPGCSIKSAVEKIKHHYSSNSSAYQSIAKWIRSGVISEIELDDGLRFNHPIAEKLKNQTIEKGELEL